ncbi:uncharacterized protein CDAR_582831 [Caerostris darwini]|uniref:Uncharacterized protein n=1 Tax=Caerostris darwini TaxID=1538125 RepID=A0AAV4PNT2_9ARAC|nr:uncharacterized protein CDAR_582831 [Caerostris darwini]
MDSLEKSEAVKKPKLKNSDEKEVPVKSYLEQLLTFVDFKESVCLVMNKISEIKKEVQADFEIGYSFHECKLLLLQQDSLELQCADIYSQYSILKQEATGSLQERNFLMKQFKEYCKILEDGSRSLATALGRRRDLITASAQFHRFLFEFRKEIQEIKDFAIRFDSCNDLQNEMEAAIQKIQDFIHHLCNISRCVFSQGLQLIDVLIKLRLSDQLKEKHRYHVGGWLAFVEVEREFRLGELNRLSIKLHFMWQLQRCHCGVRQAIEWLKDLTSSMLLRGEEIGESAEEADDLFLQHIQFQQAGKRSYEIGVQLTEIAENLRTKAGIPKEWPQNDTSLHVELEESSTEFWRVFRCICQRLDMCQNFYRNTQKLLRKLEDLVKSIRSRLKIFGEIRRKFVIQRYKKSWIKIFSAIQKCQENGRILLETLKEPLTSKHRTVRPLSSIFQMPRGITVARKCSSNKGVFLASLKYRFLRGKQEGGRDRGVNLLSNSAAIQLDRTMSQTDKTVQQVQNNYFNEEAPSATESASEYVSARSPETWRSTSISGVEDWCSIGSGTTLDDFKSLDDDLAEEYMSDDNIEELPLTDQPGVAETAAASSTRRGSAKEYSAVTGVKDSKGKKFTSHIQPGKEKLPSMQATTSGDVPTSSKDPKVSSVKETAVAVSPKSSVCFEPAKYSTVITKTESEDIKTEIKREYEIKTNIKGGDSSETFTSHKLEGTQTSKPDSKTEKIHKITFVEEPQRTYPKILPIDDFPKGTALGSSSKSELLSELEDLKSKCFKESADPSTSGIKTESKSENVSYGYSSFAGGRPTVDESGKTKTDVSKVLYSKEVTESHSFTSISFQQQSFGASRSEKWQSVTPQTKQATPMKSIEAPGVEVISEKFKKLEEEINKFNALSV